jgi:type IV secretion system protein VirB6
MIGLASVSQFAFYRIIMVHLRKKIDQFGIDLLGNVTTWVGGIALLAVTIWVLTQGYRIMSGQSRDSLMGFVVSAAKATLICSVATTMAIFGTDLHDFFTHDLADEITELVTGSGDSAEKQIDENMAWMSVAITAIDAVDTASDPTLDRRKTQAMALAGIGTGGPAIVAGSMLLLYQMAMALFVGLGPIFILCLLFDQTKSLFQRWLFYGVGTLFSMAVLAFVTSIAMEMVAKVALAMWGTSIVGAIVGEDFSQGLSSQALQQGGMGLILTTLIITAPPMAAMFFQGTLGSFSPYAGIGGQFKDATSAPQGASQSSGVRPAVVANSGGAAHSDVDRALVAAGRGRPVMPPEAGSRGVANRGGAG